MNLKNKTYNKVFKNVSLSYMIKAYCLRLSFYEKQEL